MHELEESNPIKPVPQSILECSPAMSQKLLLGTRVQSVGFDKKMGPVPDLPMPFLQPLRPLPTGNNQAGRSQNESAEPEQPLGNFFLHLTS
jgi:hypothetical protein